MKHMASLKSPAGQPALLFLASHAPALQGWLVLREVLQPLYLFQMYSVIIWCYKTEYYVFAAFVGFISLLAVMVNAWTQYRDSRRCVWWLAFREPAQKHARSFNLLRLEPLGCALHARAFQALASLSSYH